MAVLLRLLKRVQQSDHSVVLCDLDATLLSNYPRTAAIIREFAEEHNIDSLREVCASQISQGFFLEHMLRDDFGLTSAQAAEILPALLPFWKERFFRNEYLTHDEALPGAAAYITQLHTAGAHIMYVTGRFHDTMRQGTVDSLVQEGFPINVERSSLVMKPGCPAEQNRATTEHELNQHIEHSDADYKSRAMTLAAEHGTVVGIFENSRVQMNNYFAHYGHNDQALCVLVDFEHFPSESQVELQPGIHVISDFRVS